MATQRQSLQIWGSAFIGAKGRVPEISSVHSSLMNLKQKELKCWKRKAGSSSGQLSGSPEVL